MQITKLMIPVVFAMAAVCGQDKPAEPAQQRGLPPGPSFDAAIIPVTTLSGDSFNRLVKLLGVFHAQLEADEKLRTIVVYAPKDVVDKMRKVVATLDQPGSEAAIGRNIEMTLSFLKCSTAAPAQESSVPADLEGVVRQLRTATQYKDIQLLDSVPLHLQEGRFTQESLALPSGNPSIPSATGQIRIEAEGVVRKDQGRYVRFSMMQLNFRMEGS